MAETKRRYTSRRESWGSIRKFTTKSGDRYQASYLAPDGRRYNAPTTYTAKVDAQGFLAKTRVQIEQGKWKSPKAISAETFKTYATTWVEQRVSSKGAPLRPKTRAEYVRQIGAGLSEFADDRLPAISPARVRAWHHKRTADAGATMASAEARLLRAIMNTALMDEIIDKNPVPSELTRTTTGRSFRIPTAEELATLVDEVDDRFKLAVLLAAFGGLRISEWRALRRQDFTLTEDDYYVVNVTRQAQHVQGSGWVVGPTKSSAGVRTLALPPHLTEIITDHLASYVGAFPGALVFTPENAPASYVSDGTFRTSWDLAREAAGVKGVVREHDLRHFHLYEFAKAGATIGELKARGGHGTTAAAMRYQHAGPDRLAQLANALPALPAPKKSKVRSIAQ